MLSSLSENWVTPSFVFFPGRRAMIEESWPAKPGPGIHGLPPQRWSGLKESMANPAKHLVEVKYL